MSGWRHLGITMEQFWAYLSCPSITQCALFCDEWAFQLYNAFLSPIHKEEEKGWPFCCLGLHPPPHTQGKEKILQVCCYVLKHVFFFFSFSSIFLTNYFLLIFALLLSSCNTTLSSLLVSPTLLCFVETSNFKK